MMRLVIAQPSQQSQTDFETRQIDNTGLIPEFTFLHLFPCQ